MPITRDGVCGDGVDESKSSRNGAAFWMAAISGPSHSTALCDALTLCHIVSDVQGPRTYGDCTRWCQTRGQKALPARTIADLARVISERHVSLGLRRMLWVQSRRLEPLARTRLEELGGSTDDKPETI